VDAWETMPYQGATREERLMSLTDLLLSQLSDPFRIVFLIALVITMLRTQAATGTWMPLAVGALFVAVLLPVTMQANQILPLWQMIAVGLVANVILLAIIMAAWTLFQRFR
jgi:threonine/homoserine/homoserine lactone efflux protein